MRNNRRVTPASPKRLAPPTAALPAHLSPTEQLAIENIAAGLEGLDVRITALVLFGSRARGDARPDSDLDLAVWVRGRRDAVLERRIITACAEVEWSAPLEGLLPIRPLVLFQSQRPAPVHAAIAAEGVTVWRSREENA